PEGEIFTSRPRAASKVSPISAMAASWSGWRLRLRRRCARTSVESSSASARVPRARCSVSRTDQRLRTASRASRRRAPCAGARRVAVVGREQERPAVALAEVAGLDGLEGLVGQVEQADEVGHRHPATPDATADLLTRQAELLGQRRAGPRLLDGVEVLTRHV